MATNVEWYYVDNGTQIPVTSLPKDCIGLVYVLSYQSGKLYVGKKQCYSTLELPELKTEKVRKGFVKKVRHRVYRDPITNNVIVGKANISRAKLNGIQATLETFDVCLTENKWKTYTGSSKEIPKSDAVVRKRIVYFCSTKKAMTYLETKLLFMYDAAISEDFYNLNIIGKFYPLDLEGLIKEPIFK